MTPIQTVIVKTIRLPKVAVHRPTQKEKELAHSIAKGDAECEAFNAYHKANEKWHWEQKRLASEKAGGAALEHFLAHVTPKQATYGNYVAKPAQKKK